MIRLAELAVFFAPLAAFFLWRAAVARGLEGPAPRQLYLILALLIALGGVLVLLGEHERLPPGRYIPAHTENGEVIAGHSAGPGE